MIKLIPAVPDETKWNDGDVAPYVGVGIVVNLRQARQTLLLMWHNKLCGWSLPVGKAGIDEHPCEAMERELMEETGISAPVKDMICLDSVKYRTTRLGHTLEIPVHMYQAVKWSGRPKNLEPHKHASLDFIDPRMLVHLPMTFALRHWMSFRYPETYARPEEIIHDPCKGISH